MCGEGGAHAKPENVPAKLPDKLDKNVLVQFVYICIPLCMHESLFHMKSFKYILDISRRATLSAS